MTQRLLIACDGTPADRPSMALEGCRGFLPLGDPTGCSPADLAERANRAGYRVTGDGRHLCPDCARGAS